MPFSQMIKIFYDNGDDDNVIMHDRVNSKTVLI